MNDSTDLKIGLALGSGSSRGWAHIAIIKELADHGVVPQVVAGTSVGAMVGGSWLTGRLDDLEEWASRVTKFQTARFLDINARFTGFVDLARLDSFLSEFVADDEELIENFEPGYGAVTTELETARELWLTEGSVKNAVLASMSLPGLFPACRYDGKWLVDGGLVNPVPVSVCRALGANFIIAVNLNGDIVGKHLDTTRRRREQPMGLAKRLTGLTREYTNSLFTNDEESVDAEEDPAPVEEEVPAEAEQKPENDDRVPGLINSVASAVNITQDRITRSRMAGDPPDILLVPKLGHIGLLELYRAGEAMEEGRQCVHRMLPEIERLLELSD
ncbi:MAG: patatin-like phospholipase family protein [Pseudomonadales bacterium]|nr:patatin-like phospholipase family protein [Pseudomonadales bacterium]